MADTAVIPLPDDLVLTPLVKGELAEGRPVREFLTIFHLASVVLDPYTNESSWILKTATRVLDEYRDSDARTNLVVTAGPADTASFLGPLADQYLVFCDPDRAAVKAMKLEQLPAFVFTRVDGVVAAKAEGWKPEEWHTVAAAISDVTKWHTPDIPFPGDPGHFHGSPALD